MNIKELLAPAVGFDGGFVPGPGETDTAKKHLVVEEQVFVCPAAGAASIATPSVLAASTKKETRATMKPAFGMATPLTCIHEDRSAPGGPRSAAEPALYSDLSTRDVPTALFDFVPRD